MRYHPLHTPINHLLHVYQTGDRPDTKTKLKFSTFFKSVVIELDKEMYGPDNHLIEVLVRLLTMLHCGYGSKFVFVLLHVECDQIYERGSYTCIEIFQL